MIDLLFLSCIAIFTGIVLLAIGLSLVSQSLDVENYTNEYWNSNGSGEYYRNPLWHYDSKYFHYRPKGSIILSRVKWAQIEKNIGVRVLESLNAGKKIGRKEALLDIQDRVDAKRHELIPASPYLLLGVKAATPIDQIEEAYYALLNLYDPESFKGYDEEFVKLAKIRTMQIRKAWKRIELGVGEVNKS